MKNILTLILFAVCMLQVSCQSSPTKVREEVAIPPWQIEKLNALKKSFQLKDSGIWIDARSFFQYKMSHIVGSHNLQPMDFYKKLNGKKISLDVDHYFNARKFARYGISQETEVTIFGNGKAGQGEEWLMLWYLEYLGVKNVEAYNPFSKSLKENNIIPTLPSTAPTWRPNFQKRLLATPSEVEKMKKMDSFSRSRVVYIDVREREKYLKAESEFPLEVLKINIPWSEFINEDSRPNTELFTQLQQMGFRSDYTILLWSDVVSQAATATMVLQRFGFGEASLYLGN